MTLPNFSPGVDAVLNVLAALLVGTFFIFLTLLMVLAICYLYKELRDY